MSARPPIQVEFEPRFCANHVADTTAGCSFRCVYCPFADGGARRRGVATSTAMDMAPLPDVPAPPSIFLSPASDPFAPQATANTHALLAHLLPRGTGVGIVTKGVIPTPTLALLAAHRAQIEGVGVGVSSLDDARNRLLEPGCPPAGVRLDNIDRLASAGIPVALRMDPLFPLLDDDPAQLESLVCAAAGRGAYAVTATYVFAWGRYLRRLRREPQLAASCALLTERAPMEGGVAFSVPLARKLATYRLLDDLAGRHGMWFSTCGCKDLRVRDSGVVFPMCRNVFFTRSASSRAPAAAALHAPPATPPA
jgi:hypothetical protein